MKKLKSLIIFAAILATMTILFCVSASAAEWNEYYVPYTYDEDTGVMVIRGEGKTIGTHYFGETSSYCYTEDGYCDCWDFFSEPTKKELEAYYAADDAKILIIEDGVNFGMGSLCHFDKVETLILPESLTVIPSGLCYGMDNLKTVILSSGLTEIGKEAFSGCEKLTNITIPKTVKTVKREAFYGVDTSNFLFPEDADIAEGNSLIPECIEEVSVKTYSDRVSLIWEGVKDATGYRVFVRENGKWKKVKDVEHEHSVSNSAMVYNLESNTSYTFAVRPYNEFYKETYWAPTYFKIVTMTRLEDVTAKASSTSKGSVKVSWNNISVEDGYQIWISEKQSSGYKKVSNYKANTTSATVKNLESGKTYYIKVRAYKKKGDGGYNYSEYSDVIKIKVK